MRIPSGVTDQYIYFVAVDATDFATRETGLSSFTVYRSRNGGAAAAYTTPTINETDTTNMPGVYELLLDEDMTIDAGDDSQEIALHITHAGMSPVTRTIELYRRAVTAGETLTVASGDANSAVQSIAANAITATAIASSAITSAKFATDAIDATAFAQGAADKSWTSTTRILTANTNLSGLTVDVTAISGDTVAADNCEAFFDGTGYAGTNNVIPTVTTLTGHTAQTGDTYALANGATGFTAIDTVVDGIQADLSNATDGLGAIKAETALIVADTNELQTDDVPGLIAALNDVAATDIVSAGAITTLSGAVANVDLVDVTTTNTDMVAAAPTAAVVADAVWDEVQSAHVTAGSFGEIATEIASIKVTTDKFVFTIANEVDSNAKSINDVTVTGAGTAGDPWT